MSEPPQQVQPLDTATALTALLVLAAAQRDDPLTAPEDRRRTEVILADAGLSVAQIAQLTGRKYEAVKTTLRRARAATAPAVAGKRRPARPAGDAR